jgi:glycosyltransferase involved in cell wall biosynthesis
MNVLILTQYYLPEGAPGAHRLSSLARDLSISGHSVEVLTAVPNYPKHMIFGGYKNAFYQCEFIDDIKIHRSFIYTGQSFFLRLIGMLSFLGSSTINGLSKIQKPDLIICLSPPIFVALTGLILKKKYKSVFVLNVADLWPDSGIKLGIIRSSILIWILKKFEKFIYRSSDGVASQTNGILNHIKGNAPNKAHIWFKNGVDFSTTKSIPVPNKLFETDTFVFAYAGLIGHAQGIEIIIKAAHELRDERIHFKIIGDGPKLQEVKDLAQNLELDNISFLGNVDKSEISNLYSDVHASIVPLIKSDLFLGAIPSKIFDSLFLKRTVFLGVDGEAKDLFVSKYACAIPFEPENSLSLSSQIRNYTQKPEKLEELGQRGHDVVNKYFNREVINKEIIFFLENVYLDTHKDRCSY